MQNDHGNFATAHPQSSIPHGNKIVVALGNGRRSGGPLRVHKRHHRGRLPRVDGTYTGTLTASAIDLGVSEQAPLRLLVEQDGERVTASGILTNQGSTVTFVLTGTIDKTGYFTSDNTGSPDLLDTSPCGQIRPISGSLAFSGNRAVLAILIDTNLCGAISYDAELTR